MGRHYADDEFHWYALDVVRQKEHLAGLFLQRRGYMTFIPTETRYRKRNRYAKGKLEVAYAAIPGVVFCGFPSAPNWFDIMGMSLVNGVLSVDDRPRRIETASKDWLDYRSGQLDGQLIIERQAVLFRGVEVQRSARLISIQGRGVIRSPMSIKAKASKGRPLVIPVCGKRLQALAPLLGAIPQPARIAA